MKTKRVLVVAMVAVASFLSGGFLLQRRTGDQGALYRQARLFDDVLAHVSDYYVDSLSETQLYRLAIEGLLQQLGDPYSVFMERSDYEQLSESTTGNYGGLGIQIDVRDGWITVVAPLPDTPAERAGIQPGDRIIRLDSASTRDWNNDQAVRQLRGKPGTRARLTIARIGVPEPIELTIERAEIHLRSVRVAMLVADGVGYVSLSPVSATSRNELQSEIERLRREGMRSMILDLRGNPGGLLDQGVDVADLFLEPGQEIVAVRGRAPGISQAFNDRRRQQWPDLPVVVLVNEATASAAEIVAGALQDHDRALIVGTTTFGKGLVQSVFKVGPSEWLKLTTARWYTPSGRTIQVPRGPEGVTAVAVGREPLDSLGRTSAPDTAGARADTFQTEAGRRVGGGGGIVPDTVVAPDTLTTGEREFVRHLGSAVATYQDVLTSYAIELAERQLVPLDYTPRAAMRREVYQRLTARGVEVDPATYAGAEQWVAANLTYLALRYAHGRPAEFRRRMADDRQVQAAVRLASSARSPEDLLGLRSKKGE